MTMISSAGEQKIDFVTLLVTELRQQNPLEPMEVPETKVRQGAQENSNVKMM